MAMETNKNTNNELNPSKFCCVTRKHQNLELQKSINALQQVVKSKDRDLESLLTNYRNMEKRLELERAGAEKHRITLHKQIMKMEMKINILEKTVDRETKKYLEEKSQSEHLWMELEAEREKSKMMEEELQQLKSANNVNAADVDMTEMEYVRHAERVDEFNRPQNGGFELELSDLKQEFVQLSNRLTILDEHFFISDEGVDASPELSTDQTEDLSEEETGIRLKQDFEELSRSWMILDKCESSNDESVDTSPEVSSDQIEDLSEEEKDILQNKVCNKNETQTQMESFEQKGAGPVSEIERLEKENRALKEKIEKLDKENKGLREERMRPNMKLEGNEANSRRREKGKRQSGKQCTSTEEKMGVEFKQEKVIDADEYKIEKEKPEDEKLRDVTESEQFDFLNIGQKAFVELFFKTATRTDKAFTDNDTLEISGSMLEHLMFNEFVDGQIINWFMYDLEKKKCDNSPKSVFFSALSWSLVRDKRSTKAILEDVIDRLDEDTDYLFFPINTRRNKNDITGHHWTLLHVDLPNCEWTHYNSWNPYQGTQQPKEKRRDIYLEDAKSMRTYVTRLLSKWTAKNNLPTLIGNRKMKEPKCPQQPEYSVDCALYVCEFMRILAFEPVMPTEFTDDRMKRYRAKLTFEILNDQVKRLEHQHTHGSELQFETNSVG